MKLSMTVLGLIISTQFLAACNFEGKTASPALPPAHNTTPQGTGDGGGGNLINGRMIESYIINPNDLAPAQRYVLPLLKKIMPQTEEELKKRGQQDLLAIKTWYLGEFDLNNIPKKILGVEMAANQVEQVAYQTEDAIWIDSRLFNKMSEAEQARLIMHEFNMAFYLLRFETMESMCKYAQRVGGSCYEGLTPAEIKMVEAKYKPLPRRELNSNDYNIIRETTQWLFQKGEAVTEAQWKKFIRQNGFVDPRFSTDDSEAENGEVKRPEITGAMLRASLQSVGWTKSLKSTCHLSNRKESVPCDIRIEVKDRQLTSTYNGQEFKYTQPGVFITITNKQSGDVLQVSPLYIGKDSDSITLNVYNLGKIKKTSWLSISQSLNTGKQGDFGHYVEFQFDDEKSLNITEVHLTPYVIAGIETSEQTKDDKKYLCEKRIIKAVQGTNLQEDVILAGDVDIDTANFIISARGNFSSGEQCSLVK